MGAPSEISIRIRLQGAEALPSSFIATSIGIIERELFQYEYEELEVIFNKLGDLSPVIKDACYYRMRRYAGNTLLIHSAERGSLILVGVVAVLSYWVVENTVGESFKEAYKDSNLHATLKKLFLARLTSRGKELSQRLNARFFLPFSDPMVVGDVKFESNAHVNVDVDLILKKFEDVPPTPEKWLLGNNGEHGATSRQL